MLYAIIYLLVAVLMSALVLTSYVFELEEAPAFPTSEMLAKSALLALIWPVLLVVRVAIRVERRFGWVAKGLALLDLNPEWAKKDWDPAPNLLTVGRRVLVNYYSKNAE